MWYLLTSSLVALALWIDDNAVPDSTSFHHLPPTQGSRRRHAGVLWVRDERLRDRHTCRDRQGDLVPNKCNRPPVPSAGRGLNSPRIKLPDLFLPETIIGDGGRKSWDLRAPIIFRLFLEEIAPSRGHISARIHAHVVCSRVDVIMLCDQCIWQQPRDYVGDFHSNGREKGRK